jgi:bacillolysin
MNRPRSRWLSVVASLVILPYAVVSCGGVPGAVSVAALTQESQGPVAATHNPRTGRASFVRGRIPVTVFGLRAVDTSSAVAYGFMRRYAALFGTDSAARDLEYVGSRVDALGMRHMTMRQVYRGVDVYAARVAIHLAREGGTVVAVSSNAVPDVHVSTTQPAVSADTARAIAARQLLHATADSSRLVVYPGRRRASAAALAWMVEVRGFERDPARPGGDSIPARKEYVVDAGNGSILDVLDRLYTARNRMTYDVNHGTALPGTLRRTETAGPVGDADVDSAHAFVGATYDYYATTHGRDSYDGAGATLTSSVHYSTNYQNAFWDGSQMVFGDGFAVKDVTAHELTHAVTERTANLEYRWQSGALNESFSDIFGAMVDRDDWLMGEDLPIGAIRDLANPGAFGQPGNMSGWVKTCSDNEGVHTNSGIFSKAFVNIATSLGKGDAERIFYRALTTPGYLQPQSTMEDARAAALQSAADLFGATSPQEQAVSAGFAAVGLDGSFQPPANNCGAVPSIPDLSLWGFLTLAVVLGAAVVRRRRGGSTRA